MEVLRGTGGLWDLSSLVNRFVIVWVSWWIGCSCLGSCWWCATREERRVKVLQEVMLVNPLCLFYFPSFPESFTILLLHSLRHSILFPNQQLFSESLPFLFIHTEHCLPSLPNTSAFIIYCLCSSLSSSVYNFPLTATFHFHPQKTPNFLEDTLP